MKLLICGSRSIENAELIFSLIEKGLAQLLLKKEQIEEVVHGGARGVDRVAGNWAKKNNIPVKIFYPDWDTLGKRAGMLRNIEMCHYIGEKGMLLCLHDGISKGALQCYNYAQNMKIKSYKIIPPKIEGLNSNV